MEQANLEKAQEFQKNNGMTIDEAYHHVKTWYAEGKYGEVVDGCEEIIRYIPDYEDVQQILADAKLKNQENHPPETTSTAIDSAVAKKQEKKDEEYKEAIATDEKVLATIGYIGFLCILPLLLKRDSKYCSFHGKQALILAVIFFLYKYLGILRDFPIIGGLIQFILGLSMFLELIIIILAMIQAYRGKYWKMPAVYGMSKKLNF